VGLGVRFLCLRESNGLHALTSKNVLEEEVDPVKDTVKGLRGAGQFTAVAILLFLTAVIDLQDEALEVRVKGWGSWDGRGHWDADAPCVRHPFGEGTVVRSEGGCGMAIRDDRNLYRDLFKRAFDPCGV
jgi:hypothetical protein